MRSRQNIKPKKSIVNQDKAYRTLIRFSTPLFKFRFYWEPRNLWVGAFWDWRGFDFIIWVCIIPMFPIQLVFPLSELPSCPCGFKHGEDQPEWCKELLKYKYIAENLKKYIEEPLIRRRFNDEYVKELKQYQKK